MPTPLNPKAAAALRTSSPVAGRYAAALALLLLFTLPGGSLAADRDFCLEGRGIRAIEACRRALLKDADTLAVYRALGSHLEASGNLKEAIATYRRGLKAHPNDSQLAARLKISASNLEEQTWIEKRKKSEAQTDSNRSNAMFTVNKVRCTTLTGQEALAACQAALAVAPDDAALRRRISELQPPAPPPTRPEPVAPPPTQRIVKQPPPPSPAVTRQRALVAQIQHSLARLGYEPGPADGVAGARTRSAARTFADARGVKLGDPALNAQLAETLEQATTLQGDANKRLDRAAQQLARGQLGDARSTADKALADASWSPQITRRHAQLLTRLADAEATQTRQRIAAEAERAGKALRAGDLAAAQSILDTALESHPDAGPLLDVRQELAAAKIAAARQRAADERQRAGEEKLVAAQAAMDRGDLDEALTIASDGLQLAPRHAGLNRLRDDITATIEQRRLAAERAAAERAAAAAAAERERQQALAAQHEAEARARAEAQARQERLQQLLSEAETATERDELIIARQQLDLAGELAPDDPRIAPLARRIDIRKLARDAERKLRQADALANRPNGFAQRLEYLEQAVSLATDALALDPDDKQLWQLRSDIAARRSELQQTIQRQQQQREELARLREDMREQLQQLSHVETETAARDVALKLDAQRLLQKVWTN